jgi:small GTP-binding protein
MADENINRTVIKIALLGDSRVGKSTIVNKFINLDFKDDLLSTIGSDRFETKFTLKNGEKIKLIIWDTAGQERFRSIALKALKAVQGVILVFDLTKRETFENVNKWIETANENLKTPNLVLFGNKADLDKTMWKVTKEEAEDFAHKLNMKYFETSAKTRQGLEDGFSSITNDTYNRIKDTKDGEGGVQIKKDDDDEYVVGCFGKKKKKKKKKKNAS